MEEAVRLGSIDIGITYIPIPHPDLDLMKVATIAMGVFGTKDLGKFTDFSRIPFVVPNTPVPSSPSKVQGLDGWPDHLIPRNVCYRVTLLESALELCRRGVCVGYFPKFVVELHNFKVKKEFSLLEHFSPVQLKKNYRYQDVYLIKRKSELETKTIKKLFRALRALS